jgi:nucleoside-diphosphate-sugar epimerase
MSDGSRSRVLVTGGAGFIGRRTVRALLAAGAEVTSADLHAFPDSQVRSVVGDLCDPAVAAAAVSPGTDVIIHLAAVTSVLQSIEDPVGTYKINVDATASLLEQARQQIYGDGTQLRDLVHVDDILAAARVVTGAELPAEHVPPKPGEMPAVIIDISVARGLGYQPEHDLKAGIATVWPEFSETYQ